MKKAQISLFMFMFVILLIVLVMFSSVKNPKIFVPEQVVTSSVVTEYIQTCFFQASKDSLNYLGKQGGLLYNYQAPGLPFSISPIRSLPITIGGKKYNITYSIETPKFSLTIPLFPPYYPYYNSSVRSIYDPRIFGKLSLFQPSLSGLPALCDTEGMNKRNPKASYPFDNYCITYNKYRSIESFLRNYVKNKTLECTNFSIFPGANITTEKSIAKVKITDDSVIFNLEVPIKINDSSGIDSNVKDFSVTYPVRLKKIYELAVYILQEDMKNLFFHPLRDSNYLQKCPSSKPKQPGYVTCMKDGMSLRLSKNVCLDDTECNKEILRFDNLEKAKYLYTDVINLTDDKSLIDGKPFSLYLPIQNRYPVLDYINLMKGTFFGDFYDIVTIAGETITIDPYGYDPDEDQFDFICKDKAGRRCLNKTYHYYGWKATYDETFVMELGGKFKKRDSSNIDSCSFPYMNCMSEGKSLPNYKQDETNYNNNWETSSDFITTGRKASYITKEEDVGLHILRVKICDESNVFCDWQDLKILVMDIPSFGSSGYTELVDKNYASIEDGYTFLTNLEGYNIKKVDWISQNQQLSSASSNPFKKKVTGDIRTIPSFWNNLNPNNNNKLKTKLTFNDDSIQEQEEPFPLLQCLPIAKTETNGRTNRAPYPYQNFKGDNYDNEQEDEYQGAHVCCQGDINQDITTDSNWGKYENTNKICYNMTYLTCNPYIYLFKHGKNNKINLDDYKTEFNKNYFEFNNKLITPYNEIPPLNMTVTENGKYNNRAGKIEDYDDKDITFIYHKGPINAVYNRSFNQKCSGNRGNVCSGEISEDVWKMIEFKDNNNNDCYQNINPDSDETGHCRAPNGIVKTNNPDGYELTDECINGQKISLSSTCQNLNVPFEKLVDNSQSEICNTNKRCAHIVPEKWFSNSMDSNDVSFTNENGFNALCNNLKCEDGSCTKVTLPKFQCEFSYESNKAKYISLGSNHINSNDTIKFEIPGCTQKQGDDKFDSGYGKTLKVDLDSAEYVCYNTKITNHFEISEHVNMSGKFNEDSNSNTKSAWLPSGENYMRNGTHGEYNVSNEKLHLNDSSVDNYLPNQNSLYYYIDDSSFGKFDCCGDDKGEFSVIYSSAKSCGAQFKKVTASFEKYAICCDNKDDFIQDYYGQANSYPGNPRAFYCVSECVYFGTINKVKQTEENGIFKLTFEFNDLPNDMLNNGNVKDYILILNIDNNNYNTTFEEIKKGDKKIITSIGNYDDNDELQNNEELKDKKITSYVLIKKPTGEVLFDKTINDGITIE